MLQYNIYRNWITYSSANLNPSKTKSSSKPGGGKCALIQLTAHNGKGTLISLPRISQHHLTNCLYATCRCFLCSGPSKAFAPYCCRYWLQASRHTQTFKHIFRNTGLSVIHSGMAIPSNSADSWFIDTQAGISWQQTHSSFLSIICQWVQRHLHV